MMFTGTTVTYGRGRAVVRTGMHTEFGKIAQQVAAVETEQRRSRSRTNEIGRWLGIITLGICVVVIGGQHRQGVFGRNAGDDLRFCPCPCLPSRSQLRRCPRRWPPS